MKINSSFDSGNIEVVSTDTPSNITLNIRTDSNSEFKQWFHFKAHAETGQSYGFEILNAKDCSYVDGWENYQVVASYDRQYWFRVDTELTDDKTLKFKHQFEQATVYFAYFEPYSYERHQNLIQVAQLSERCEHRVLGHTVDGRDMDLLVIGDESKERKIWVTARQHPGETMAEWCAEGLIERLLDDNDALSRSLLESAVFYVVPNMNVDGSYRGNLRSNAAGANLNREWQNPSMDKSPEVFLVRELMQKTGVDAYLDLHGDEALPYVFVAGTEGVPSYSDSIVALEDEFKTVLEAVNPDFQDEVGYDKDEPGKANLTVANSWVGEEFKCLSYTLEMPFKDNNNHPDPLYGWSPERSVLFGQDVLAATLTVADKI